MYSMEKETSQNFENDEKTLILGEKFKPEWVKTGA